MLFKLLALFDERGFTGPLLLELELDHFELLFFQFALSRHSSLLVNHSPGLVRSGAYFLHSFLHHFHLFIQLANPPHQLSPCMQFLQWFRSPVVYVPIAHSAVSGRADAILSQAVQTLLILFK